MKARLAVAMLMVVGCGERVAPGPRLGSVRPDRGVTGADVDVFISGEFLVPRQFLDFDRPGRSVVDADFEVRLGAVRLTQVQWDPAGLRAVVPASALPGLYELKVTDPSGREASLADAYRVLSSGESALLVERYGFDSIGQAVAGEPFTITVAALDGAGARVDGFDGWVDLSGSGQVVPRRAGYFVHGQWSGSVELGTPGTGAFLHARDALGNSGSSAPFRVLSAATALAIGGGVGRVSAGECSGPWTIDVMDAHGILAPVDAAVPVQLAAEPAGTAAWFGDAVCSQALSSATIAALARGSVAWVRVSAAGHVLLRASAVGFVPAERMVVAEPGAAVRLAFTTAPQLVTVGACSKAVGFQLEDGAGNSVPASAAMAVGLEALPAGALTFFLDPACGTPQATVPLGAGTSSGTFYFRGAAVGAASVVASASGLAAASQSATVVGSGVATTLAFTTPPRTARAGECSTSMRVELQDSLGSAVNATATTTLALSAPGAPVGFELYLDSQCAGSPAGSLVLAAGQSAGTFFFRGAKVGPAPVNVSATGLLGATQAQQVTPAVTSSLVFSPVASPQLVGQPLAVSVQAIDAYGNDTPLFVGQAALSLAPAGTLGCSAGCAASTTTTPFVAGAWSGVLSFGLPAGTGRVLTASSGAVSGSSNPFEVRAVVRAPPLARLAVSPAAVLAGQPVTLDAQGSTDTATTPAALEVSWDTSGQAGAPPWTPWSTTKSTTATFAAAGANPVRVAVRDQDQDLGFAGRTVLVVAAPSRLCRVSTNALVDDGATACAGPFGADGALSLAEAMRLANASAQTVTITFASAMTVTGPATFSVTRPVDVAASAGVVWEGLSLDITQGPVQLSGLELRGAGAELKTANDETLTVRDSSFVGPKLAAGGLLTLANVSMAKCAGSCVELNSSAARLDAAALRLLDSPLAHGIRCVQGDSQGNRPTVTVRASVLSGLAVGLSHAAGCPNPVVLRNNTFHANGVGLELLGGTKHILRNNVFSQHSSQTLQGCTRNFSERTHHLLFQNVSNDCLAGDPNALVADPLYVDPAALDLRPQRLSPATNSGFDTGVDVNGVAPGNFTGTAPDRGAHDVW